MLLGYRTLSVILPIGGHGVMPDQSLSEEDGQEYSLGANGLPGTEVLVMSILYGGSCVYEFRFLPYFPLLCEGYESFVKISGCGCATANFLACSCFANDMSWKG